MQDKDKDMYRSLYPTIVSYFSGGRRNGKLVGIIERTPCNTKTKLDPAMNDFSCDYVPKANEDKESAPCLAYVYDRAEIDGGTLILADSANYDSFVAGLVRLKYSQNQVEAILCNQGDGSDEHLEEFNALQMYQKECKQVAAEILARAS